MVQQRSQYKHSQNHQGQLSQRDMHVLQNCRQIRRWDRDVIDRQPDQQAEYCVHRQRNVKPFSPFHPATRANLKSWCTGEDSNLRSSEERQIYSLLPLTTRSPVQFTELVRADPPLAGSLWLVTTGRFHLFARNEKRNQETRKHTPASDALQRFTEVIVGYAFPVRKSLCAVPFESETRQPARLVKNPLLQLELAKGLEPLTL
jgi:hypothetical protein